MRKLIVHLAGGTEVTMETPADPGAIYEALTGKDDWLIVEDKHDERHYFSIRQIAYLTFVSRQDIGFS